MPPPRLTAVLLLLATACAHAPRAPAAEEGFVTANDGSRLWYRKLGTGAPTVIIPLAFILERHLAGLARDRTVVLYDPRNRARSSPVGDDARISIQADVDDLEAVRAHVGADRVIPVGFSYFGEVVALYARAHPERVERLVQLGPVAPAPGQTYPAGQSMPPETMGPELTRLAAEVKALRDGGEAERDPAAFCAANDAFMRRLLTARAGSAARMPAQCGWEREWPSNLDRHFGLVWRSIYRSPAVTKDSLAAVRAPVLVVHGRQDRNAPYGAGREWAAFWREARLVSVDEAAHAVWVDDPSVLADLETFLRGRWPARAAVVTGAP